MDNKIHFTYRKFRKDLMPIQEWWDFIATVEHAEVEAVVNRSMAAEERLRVYKNTPRFRFKIRAYCNLNGYSDVNPFEVVRVISEKCVEVRAMQAELTKKPTLLGVGGFSAVYENHSQEWKITQDEEATVTRIHLGKKGWGQGRYHMADEPIKFYDYNF